MKRVFYCLALWITLGCTTTTPSSEMVEDKCIEKRAAIDIGSGSTRLKVAKVDICKMRLGEILLDKQEKVSYQDALQRSKDQTLSQDVIAQGASVVKRFKLEALTFAPKNIVATATSAFRTAKNGKNAAQEIGRTVDMEVRVIDQDEEGKLGFLGAAQHAGGDLKNVVVWDIGGGSQQISFQKSDGAIDVYKTTLASETFKDYLMKKVQRRAKAISPNPISAKDKEKSLVYIKKYLNDVPPSLKDFLKNPTVEVVGIGGVHYYSVKGQVGNEVYDDKAVLTTLDRRLGLTDEKVGGEFASTDVSNLLLVKGTMDALGIRKVGAAKINLTDGAMLYKEFWAP